MVSDAEVLRIEDMDITEVRLYIAVAENAKSHEYAYSVVLERGYGSSKQKNVFGECRFGTSKQNMVYRAAAAALAQFTAPGQVINRITIFVEQDLGWELRRNSWSLSSGAFDSDASLYSQMFRACCGQKITISIAPTTGKCTCQEIADGMVAQIVHTPA